ncbi:MAG: hypothetical protein HY914_19505 [Desulfomonile tiedjei]|nr:hypothetical protein [Desulfomonile tiedjei]
MTVSKWLGLLPIGSPHDHEGSLITTRPFVGFIQKDLPGGDIDMMNQKTDGTGIGPALAKRIVDVHGARIRVESPGVGTGSTFCFPLPRAIRTGEGETETWT